MFEFLKDIGNYNSRCVGRHVDHDTDLFVSTARVSDGEKPYETAVQHPDYNNGEMVIVESYDTREESQMGHEKWVEIMTTTPPDEITDCCNSHTSSFISLLGAEITFKKKGGKD